MPECPRLPENAKECTCTYAGCSRHAKCCECLHYHRKKGALPACFFPADVERTYDRSVKRFVDLHKT